MRLESKYNFGDEVYWIHHHTKEIKQTCEYCEGKGDITYKDKKIQCPECYGRGTISKWTQPIWQLSRDLLTIGQIQITAQKKLERAAKQEIYYMAYSTGIGGGSLYHEKDLFLSEEEAQAECDLRNIDPDNPDHFERWQKIPKDKKQ